jgi:hypothetical protein
LRRCIFHGIIIKQRRPVKNKGISALGAVLLVLIVVSCDGIYISDGYKRVGYDMRGTWECTEAAPWPEGHPKQREKGLLVLDYDTITITGPVAHLRDFTRGIALEAYTEDTEDLEDSKTGLLYIKDRGELQNSISYRRWQSGGTPKDEMLTLTGGGIAYETFKKIKD